MASVIDTDHFRSRAAASQTTGGSGGGGMDQNIGRLERVEVLLGDLRVTVGAISAVLPHLATKSDLHAVKEELGGRIERFKDGVGERMNSLEARMSASEWRMIRWFIGTAATLATLAFAAAKLVS
jgi:hypothetical protein